MKRHRSTFWSQEWGTYGDITLVCVGFEKYEDLLPFIRKQKCYEWEAALKQRNSDMPPVAHPHFTSWYFKKKFYSVLWLPHWKDNIAHYETLGHELVHGVCQVLGERMDLMKENEAFAYQHSFLFTAISSHLQGKRYG